MKEKIASYIADESPFCEKCKNDSCPSKDLGCKDWKAYFIKNWNQNISTYRPDDKVEKIFRYEHPDLIREGIVWTGG